MRCPRCQGALTRTHRHGVEIDSCPRCQGVWLDRGELQKLIQAVSDRVPDSEPDGREHGDQHADKRDDNDDNHAEVRRGRRSFLNDLFDIG